MLQSSNSAGRHRLVMVGLSLGSVMTLTAASLAQTAAPPNRTGNLFTDTGANLVLVDPVDPAVEKSRAQAEAGRADPFIPLPLAISTPTPLPPPPVALPGFDSGSGFVVEATPTPDPARFAKSILVSGVVNIGNDTFALVSANNAIPGVVRIGDRYQTASVTRISLDRQEITLKEGGQTVTRRVNEPAIATN